MTNNFKVGTKVRIIPNDENFNYVRRHYQMRFEFVIKHIEDNIVYTTDNPMTEPGIGIWRLELDSEKLSEKFQDKNLKWGVLEVKSQKMHHIFWMTRSMARCARKILQADHDDKKFKVVKVNIEYLP